MRDTLPRLRQHKHVQNTHDMDIQVSDRGLEAGLEKNGQTERYQVHTKRDATLT
jgi:hypothetical protein